MNNMDGATLLSYGEVVAVENLANSIDTDKNAGAWRVRVRMDSDGKDTPYDKLSWAFPLLPKTIQSIPKVGEGVFVINAVLGKDKSQKFYIGPIIPQAQFQEYAPYKGGRGEAMSTINQSKPLRAKELFAIDKARELTKGAYPNLQDVALIGRGQEDIILKYRGELDKKECTSEIDLRAGIRLKPTDNTYPYLKGNVVFNNESPTYIQIKHKQNGIAGFTETNNDSPTGNRDSQDDRAAQGVINIVADKINLISPKLTTINKEEICDQEELVKEKEMDMLMSKLHKAVYGDELVSLLEIMVDAIKTHTHDISIMPPNPESPGIKKLNGIVMGDILSPNVRIS